MKLKDQFQKNKEQYEGLSDFTCLVRAVHQTKAKHSEIMKVLQLVDKDDMVGCSKSGIEKWLMSIAKGGSTKPSITP